MRRLPRWPLLFAALCAATGCYDTAVLGAGSPVLDAGDPGPDAASPALDAASTEKPEFECRPACSGDEHCHPQLHVCVHCMVGRDCGDAGLLCMDGACVGCRDDLDCPIGQRCEQDSTRCGDDNRGPGNSDDPRGR